MFNSPELNQAFDDYRNALQAEIASNMEAAEDYARIAKTLEKTILVLLPSLSGIIGFCLYSL